jgi:hypothetical protein
MGVEKADASPAAVPISTKSRCSASFRKYPPHSRGATTGNPSTFVRVLRAEATAN